jgi:hypothetical protein
MYHLELRQFPHNVCRFNVSEQDLGAIVGPWVREEWIDVEDRKWNANQARLTIIEGPKLSLDQLKMGRGWSAAKREGTDVTERVLDAAVQAMPAALSAQPAAAPGAAGGAQSDPLALSAQIRSLLGPDPVALLDAWRAVAAGVPGLTPSQSLARAEQALRPDAGDAA